MDASSVLRIVVVVYAVVVAGSGQAVIADEAATSSVQSNNAALRSLYSYLLKSSLGTVSDTTSEATHPDNDYPRMRSEEDTSITDGNSNINIQVEVPTIADDSKMVNDADNDDNKPKTGVPTLFQTSHSLAQNGDRKLFNVKLTMPFYSQTVNNADVPVSTENTYVPVRPKGLQPISALFPKTLAMRHNIQDSRQDDTYVNRKPNTNSSLTPKTLVAQTLDDEDLDMKRILMVDQTGRTYLYNPHLDPLPKSTGNDVTTESQDGFQTRTNEDKRSEGRVTSIGNHESLFRSFMLNALLAAHRSSREDHVFNIFSRDLTWDKSCSDGYEHCGGYFPSCCQGFLCLMPLTDWDRKNNIFRCFPDYFVE